MLKMFSDSRPLKSRLRDSKFQCCVWLGLRQKEKQTPGLAVSKSISYFDLKFIFLQTVRLKIPGWSIPFTNFKLFVVIDAMKSVQKSKIVSNMPWRQHPKVRIFFVFTYYEYDSFWAMKLSNFGMNIFITLTF